MDVDRVELMEALTKIKPGIANKEFLEQSTHFILDKDYILTYNDEISILYPFDIGVECTIEAGLLYKLVSKMEEDIVTFKMNKTTLKIECGDVKAKLPIVVDSQILGYVNKLSEEQEKLTWHKLPKDFLDAVKLCAFSASTDKTLGTLTCVWIEGQDVLSFDKYRGSWYQMESEVAENFYIDAEYIAQLNNFEDPTQYCISKSWAHFEMANGIVFSARLTIPDKLLPLRDKFNKFEHDARVSLPDTLSTAIDTVSLTVEQQEKLNQRITIEFRGDLIKCTGSSEKGTITKELHLEKALTCEPFAIEARPKAMIEVLDKASHLLVGKLQGMFKSREKRGFQHLIALKVKED